MPASRNLKVGILLGILSLSFLSYASEGVFPQSRTILAPSLSQLPGVSSALTWLERNQGSDGSYGPYFEGQTAAAEYALWLNDSKSSYAARSAAYLAKQLNDSMAWFWGSFGEADIPGEVLFSMATTQHLSLIPSLSLVSSRLLQFQQSSGGFKGYYDFTKGQAVTSSVDTAMALWGLWNSETVGPTDRAAAISYLLTLQNPDGSFNLTSTIPADPVFSLGPDRTSITALVALVLLDSGFNLNSTPVAKDLDFLSKSESAGFGGQGHVYAASLTALAFLAFQPRYAATSLAYLMAQQKSDGGFSDVTRSMSSSNALDTGWAATALQFGVVRSMTTAAKVNSAPIAMFNFAPQEPENGTTVSFDASSSSDHDGDSLSYAWTFGDGGSGNGATAAHVYLRNGVFTVTLTVTDTGVNPNALSSTTWQTVTVLQSGAPARIATQPSQLAIIGIPVAIIGAAIVLGYVAFTLRRRRISK